MSPLFFRGYIAHYSQTRNTLYAVLSCVHYESDAKFLSRLVSESVVRVHELCTRSLNLLVT